MHPVEALKLLREHRTDEVIIATMGAEREWLKLSQHPRDFCYVPSSMGQAPTLGLGLALARPDLRVVVLNGDGCMLMNLGYLVTIAEQSPRNYALAVVKNGVYEVTGGQRVAGAGRAKQSPLAPWGRGAGGEGAG
jgi:sulfopyruvate decarboxylase subunit beta